MTTVGSFNTKNPTIKRILREAKELDSLTTTDYVAAPLETNLFEWHFTIRGPPGTPYASGIYHGRIVLPPSYPLRPPSFRFLTPSGRFEPNREICLSISGHHEESWQPAWGIRTALVAIRAFMEGDAKGQVGGVEAGKEVRERLAGESRRWRCGACGKTCEDIIKAKEEEVGGEAHANKKEEEVPDELKLGFKDEMGKKQEEPKETEKSAQQRAVTEAPVPPPTPPQAPPASVLPARAAQTTSNRSIEPRQTLQPTRTVPLQVAQQVQSRRQDDDRILNRLDLAIAAFAAALAYMIIRKIAGWI